MGTAWLFIAITIYMLGYSQSVRAADAPRFALLIGNQNYAEGVGPLKNPKNDIAIIKSALLRVGFPDSNISVMTDASRVAMLEAFDAFAARAGSAGPEAITFFYYSGHGAANDRRDNFLIPVDVAELYVTGFWHRSVSLRDLLERLNSDAPNAKHFVIFDACRNTLKLKEEGLKAAAQPKGFQPVRDIPGGMLIAFATAEGELAYDAGNGAGPYASALAEEIVKPGVEAVTVFRNVQLRLSKSIGQKPWTQNSPMSAVYFAGDVPEMAPEQKEDIRLWDSVKESADLEAIGGYLTKFPKGLFAPVAQALIKQIAQERKLEQAVKEEELRRAEAERREAEVRRLENELKMREAAIASEQKRIEEAKTQQREEERRRQAEEKAAALKAEEQRKADEARLAAQKKQDEEARTAAALKKQEQDRKAAEEKAAALKAEEQRKADEARLAAQKKQEEEAKTAEALRKLGEDRRAAEEQAAVIKAEAQRKADETRLAEERRQEEERARTEEIRKLKEELARQTALASQAVLAAKAAEQQRSVEEKAATETSRKATQAKDEADKARERREKQASLGSGKETHRGEPGQNCGARTCSQARAGCLAKGAPGPRCAALYGECMQTGEFIGRWCQHTGLARR